MEHTFVICAYKESPYLLECVASLKRQSVKSEIILATSTPSKVLEELCEREGIVYCIREGTSGIAPDWNFALSCASTPYVTIAHQDDVYYEGYAREMLKALSGREDALIAFSKYEELKNAAVVKKGVNMRIKEAILAPLLLGGRAKSRFFKRWCVRFGNAICCPTVTYCMEPIKEYLSQIGQKELFRTHFRSNLDWETWELLSHCPGSFLYVKQPLMAHRIHEESETSATIADRERGAEDYEMFQKFWPKWLARRLSGWYGASEKSNMV